MASTSEKLLHRARRKAHTDKKIHGTSERPRLVVFRSNAHMYAQVIDDDRGHTLVAASTIEPDVKATIAEDDKKGAAKKVGMAAGKKALAAGITKVVFDRSGYKYHGRVAAVAEGAREAGLDF